MIIINVFDTLGIVSTIISNRANINPGCSRGGDVWLSPWWEGTVFILCNELISHSISIISKLLFLGIFSQQSMAFSQTINSIKSITIVTVGTLQNHTFRDGYQGVVITQSISLQ